MRAESRDEFVRVRAELATVRAEAREDSHHIRGELIDMRERIARIEERNGIKAAAS